MTYKEFSNLVKQAAAQAGFSMPGDAGNALSPAPAAMPIKKQDPLAAAGAAPAEPEAPQDPITALSSSLDKITAVANKQVAQNAPPQQPQQPSIAAQVPPMPAGDAIPKAASFGKKAFIPYGAGYMANQLMKDYDNSKENQGSWTRDLVKKNQQRLVNNAMLPTALAAGGAGLGTAGLAYAGLGLIPGMRKNRLARFLTSAAIGVPVGALAGHYVGKASWRNGMNNPIDMKELKTASLKSNNTNTGDIMNYLDVQRLRNEVAADMCKQAARVNGIATRGMAPMGVGNDTRGVEEKDIAPKKEKKDYSKAISVGKNVGIGAGIGALGGAVSGALSKKKDGESRAKKVLKHMAIGAGIGGAAGGVGGELADTEAVKSAIAWLKDRLAKKQPKVEAPGNVVPGPISNRFIGGNGRQVFPI